MRLRLGRQPAGAEHDAADAAGDSLQGGGGVVLAGAEHPLPRGPGARMRVSAHGFPFGGVRPRGAGKSGVDAGDVRGIEFGHQCGVHDSCLL